MLPIVFLNGVFLCVPDVSALQAMEVNVALCLAYVGKKVKMQQLKMF